MMESVTEITTSFARGNLRGVIILEKGYDEKRGDAWTKVGISQRTIAAAAGFGAAMNAGAQGDDGTARVGRAGENTGIGEQPSEVRRTAQKEW